MKLLFLFLVCLSSVPFLSAQNDTTVIQRVAFYNNKTIERIDTFKVQVDLIKQGNELIYLKLQPKTGDAITLEYFKLKESHYLHRKYQAKKLLEEGTLTIGTKPFFVDTVIMFDPETFDEVYTIYEGYRPIKIGNWQETDSLGRSINGSYAKGKKEGNWSCYEAEQPLIEWTYANGILLDSVIPDFLSFFVSGVNNLHRPNACAFKYIPSEIDDFTVFFPSQFIEKKDFQKAVLTAQIIKSNYPTIPVDTLAKFHFNKKGFVSSKFLSSYNENLSAHYYIRNKKNKVIEYKNEDFDRIQLKRPNVDSALSIYKYSYPEKGVVVKKQRARDYLGNLKADSLGTWKTKKYDKKGRLIESNIIRYSLWANNKIDTFDQSTRYEFDEKKHLGIAFHLSDQGLRSTDTIQYTDSWKISASENSHWSGGAALYGNYYTYNNKEQVSHFKRNSFFNYESYAHCPDAGNYELYYEYDKLGLLQSIRYLFSDTEILIQVTYLK
jgi:hypothetical protein